MSIAPAIDYSTGMVERLKNVLFFVNLAPGASVAVTSVRVS